MTDCATHPDQGEADPAPWVSAALAGVADLDPAQQLQQLRDIHARLREEFARAEEA